MVQWKSIVHVVRLQVLLRVRAFESFLIVVVYQILDILFLRRRLGDFQLRSLAASFVFVIDVKRVIIVSASP